MKNFIMFIIFALMLAISVVSFVIYGAIMSNDLFCINIIAIIINAIGMTIFTMSDWVDSKKD